MAEPSSSINQHFKKENSPETPVMPSDAIVDKLLHGNDRQTLHGRADRMALATDGFFAKQDELRKAAGKPITTTPSDPNGYFDLRDAALTKSLTPFARVLQAMLLEAMAEARTTEETESAKLAMAEFLQALDEGTKNGRTLQEILQQATKAARSLPTIQ